MIWTEPEDFDDLSQPMSASSSATDWQHFAQDLAEFWRRFAGRVGDARLAFGVNCNTVTLSHHVGAGTITAFLGSDEEPWNVVAEVVKLSSELLRTEFEKLPSVDDDEDGFSDGYDALMDRVQDVLQSAAGQPDVMEAMRKVERDGSLRYLFDDAEDPRLVNGLLMPHQRPSR